MMSAARLKCLRFAASAHYYSVALTIRGNGQLDEFAAAFLLSISDEPRVGVLLGGHVQILVHLVDGLNLWQPAQGGRDQWAAPLVRSIVKDRNTGIHRFYQDGIVADLQAVMRHLIDIDRPNFIRGMNQLVLDVPR